MDRVFIENLEIETIIGVYDWERKIPQRLRVSLEMKWDNRIAASSGELSAALDYKAVADRVSELVIAEEFELLETAAEAIASMVHEEFSVGKLRLRLAKPDALADAEAVGIEIKRSRPGPHD